MLAAFHTQGKVDRETLLEACVIVAALILAFFVVFRLDLNLHFPDPSLTEWQLLGSVFTMLYVVYRAPDTRIAFTAFFFVALMFGMLRHSGTKLTVLGSVSLLSFLTVSALRYRSNGELEMLRLDMLQLIVMAVTLPWFVFIGVRVKRLQRGLTEATIKLEDIEEQASHDELTGIYNRRALLVAMEEAKRRADFTGEPLSICVIDLDFFKDVNDALGHPIGDALLRRAAERLRSCIRENDTVSRLGGDEFAIIQDGVKDPAHMGALATRIVEVIGEPFHLDGQDVVVSASVGIATAPHDAADPDSLLKYADMALYAAKTDGRRTFRFFEPDMDARLHARRALEIDLRAAFVREEFELYYQPTLDLASEAVIGFEALLRWNHPERGLVSPGEFIPLAETVGLIIPLGEWVLRQACTEAAGWAGDIAVSVNLSPAQFKNGDIVRTVIQALAASGLAARRLELEITETVLLQENENNLATLHQLRGLGVRIALDDFGTGYSSLSYLRTFPFDRIKIDGSFVKELPNNTECVSIVRAVIGLAKGLDMATTAEGVETLAQFEHLRADGCTNGQGYLFGRPRPAAEARALLAQHRAIAGYAA